MANMVCDNCGEQSTKLTKTGSGLQCPTCLSAEYEHALGNVIDESCEHSEYQCYACWVADVKKANQ